MTVGGLKGFSGSDEPIENYQLNLKLYSTFKLIVYLSEPEL